MGIKMKKNNVLKKKTDRKAFSISSKLVVVISIFILVVVSAQVLIKDYIYSMAKTCEYMTITLNSEKMIMEDENANYLIYENMSKNKYDFYLDYSSFYLNTYGFTRESVANLSTYSFYDMFFIDGVKDDLNLSGIRVIKPNQNTNLVLNETELTELFSKGSYIKRTDDMAWGYKSRRAGKGFIILRYAYYETDTMPVEINSVHSLRDDEILVKSDKNGIITFCSEAAFLGRNLSETFHKSNISSDKYDLYQVEDYGWGISICDRVGDTDLTYFVPFSSISREVLRGSIVPMILFWVIIITILIYVLKIRKNEKTAAEFKNNNIVFGKRFVLNRTIVSHILVLGLFGIILISTSVIYVRALLNYSNQNINANLYLKRLTESYNSNIESREDERLYLEEQLVMYTELISLGFISKTDSIDSDLIKKLTNSVKFVEDVNVLDKTATIIAGSTNEEGYTFGQGDNQIGNMCWQILNGDTESAVFFSHVTENGAYHYYIAVRRQDAKGVVIADYTIDNANAYFERWSLKETLKTADIGDAYCMAVNDEALDKIYITAPGSDEVLFLDVKLNDNILQNGYNGIGWIKGIKYYINTLRDSDYNLTFISALPIKRLLAIEALAELISIIIGIILLELILCMSAGLVEAPESEAEKTEYHRILFDKNSLIDNGFRTVISRMMMATGLLLVLLLMVDYFLESQPLLSYLFGSQWNKGVNLFSVTMILIIMVGSMVIGLFLDKLIILICNNMGPRGMTIGHLMGSLARFIIFIVSIILALKELGLNMTALLTGAGIAGAAISFCANNSVNDLLSGFFIVFEGAFQIGDWIKVEDWRGQVLEIGMRTTKVAYADCIKIINNSKLTNVTVLDITNSGGLARVDIAYREKADKVIELISSNRQRYKDSIPEIEDGPYVKGIVDLSSNGVTLEMYGNCEQEYAARVERGMRLITKQIFDENGIEIPFNQVTIHQADEVCHFNGVDIDAN